jgi:hypothetical protein
MANVKPSWTMRPRANDASSPASVEVISSMRRAISVCGVTSMSSSAKSMPASSRAISSTSDCFAGAARRLSAPPIWLAAWRACVNVCASIRSRTASACVRSSRPARKARWVNSPGSARRAPSSSARRNRSSSTTGEPCAAISTRSSDVYELGAAKNVTSASSMLVKRARAPSESAASCMAPAASRRSITSASRA